MKASKKSKSTKNAPGAYEQELAYGNGDEDDFESNLAKAK